MTTRWFTSPITTACWEPSKGWGSAGAGSVPGRAGGGRSMGQGRLGERCGGRAGSLPSGQSLAWLGLILGLWGWPLVLHGPKGCGCSGLCQPPGQAEVLQRGRGCWVGVGVSSGSSLQALWSLPAGCGRTYRPSAAPRGSATSTTTPTLTARSRWGSQSPGRAPLSSACEWLLSLKHPAQSQALLAARCRWRR